MYFFFFFVVKTKILLVAAYNNISLLFYSYSLHLPWPHFKALSLVFCHPSSSDSFGDRIV